MKQAHNELAIAALILTVTLLGPFASDSYLPSLPAMAQALGSNAHMLKLTITLYLLGFSVSQLIYGPLSDRFGRRHLILVGLAIGFIGSVLCTMVPSIGWLLAARFIQGAGIGASNALFRAIMRDVFSGARMAKIASYASMLFALAPAVAPILGGYIQVYFGWRANFIFTACLFAGVLALIWYALPETNRDLNPHAAKLRVIWQNYRILLTNKAFMGYVTCSSLALSGFFAYCAMSPFLLQNILHLSPVQYGWLAVVIAVGLMLGSFINSLLVTRIAMDKLILIGISLMIMTGVVMFGIGLYGILNVAVVLVPTCIFLIAGGLVFSNAMAGAFAPFAKMAGSAGAMYGCLQVFGTFITTLIVAGLQEKNQVLLAGIFILLGVLSLGIYHFCINGSRVGKVCRVD